jgi:hypothetical protein
MSDVQISVTETDVQIAVIDQENTQLALAAPDETQVNIAVPGVQGPIGATGTIAGAQDGTAAAPGISFLADTNTGIYRPGADQLAISTGGTGRLFVDASGRVGIGTASPDVRTHIVGTSLTKSWSADANDFLAIESSSSTAVDMRSGSTAGGNIFFSDGDARARGRIEYSHLADELRFGTAGTYSRVVLDSSGRLGIGIQTLGAILDVNGSADTVLLSNTTNNASTKEAKIQLRHYTSSEENLALIYGYSTTTANGVVIGGGPSGNNAATEISFRTAANQTTTAGTERVRIDSSGRLLVGTTSPRTISGASGKLQIEGTTDAYVPIVANRNDVGGPGIFLAKSRGTAVGANTVVAADDQLGQLRFYGTDGTAPIEAASIFAYVDGTPGTNDMPGRLVFSTTADGAASPTERMRISQSGTCSINTTLAENSAYFDGKLRVLNSATAFSSCSTGVAGAVVHTVWHQATTGNNNFITFGTETTHTLRGSISYNRAGGLVAYNTTSDYRSKTILGAIENTGETIDALKVYLGVMNDATIERPMLVAHEVQEVAPYCVTGEKDAVDDNGDPIYQQIDHQVLVPLLIAEIQQLRARVAALEAQ